MGSVGRFTTSGSGLVAGPATTWRARDGRRRVRLTVLDAPAVDETEAVAAATRMAQAERFGRHPLVATVEGYGFTEAAQPWIAVQDYRRTYAGAVLGVGEAVRVALVAGEALQAVQDAGEHVGAITPADLVRLRDGSTALCVGLTDPGGDDARGLAETLIALVGGTPEPGLRAILEPALTDQPPSVRELCSALSWVARAEGWPVDEPTGLTLQAVWDAPVDLGALGWVPGVLTSDDVAAALEEPAPRVDRRRVRRAVPAMIGLSALVVAGSGLAYAVAPPARLAASSAPAAVPSIEPPDPWSDTPAVPHRDVHAGLGRRAGAERRRRDPAAARA